MSILIFIVVLFVLVVVHEYGHYKVAKFFGARVDEFGFGYPPKIATLFKKGETEFTLNALPFGGFVKIYGEDDTSLGENVDTRALFNKPKWQQALVLVAGVFMNIVLAGVLFSVGFMIGLPSSMIPSSHATNQNNTLTISEIEKGSVAESAALAKNDQILKIESSNQPALENPTAESLGAFLQNTKSQPVEITFRRDASVFSKTITPSQDQNGKYRLGVLLGSTNIIKLSFIQSIISGFKLAFVFLVQIFVALFDLLKNLVTGQSSNASVTGPVGIVKSVGQAYNFGIAYLLALTGLISLNLAAINILPIPALDGGRLFFLLIEKIKGSRINQKLANNLNMSFFFVLVGLMILVTVFDVIKLFK